MGLFGQAKDLYKLQKQAKKVKGELKNLHIEAEYKGVTVTASAELEVIDVKISEEAKAMETNELEAAIKEAINKALKKAQEVAAERMRDLMGGLGLDLPGTPNA